MTREYILMSRTEDEEKSGMPTLQFVDAEDKQTWLRVTGLDIMRREAESGRKHAASTDSEKKLYRITIEEVQ